MKDRLAKLLSQAYPIQSEGKIRWRTALVFGLFVGFFLWAFEPFELRAIVLPYKELYIWGYGAITALLMILNVVIIRGSFPQHYQESAWTVGKEMLWILWNVLTIAFGNFCYSIYWFDFSWNMSSLLFFVLATIGVGLFPIVLLVFWNANRLLRKHLVEAQALEQQLPSLSDPTIATSPPPMIRLQGENQKDELSLSADSLLFIKSADNYVEVYYVVEGGMKKTLLRSSLSRIEKQLGSVDTIMRCHRAYLVNLPIIEHFEGDSQGYKLFLRGTEDIVPVSRRYIKLFRERYLILNKR